MTDANARANALAEFAKAQAARRAAEALTELGLHDDAISRLYYAAFHVISAALLSLGVQAHTHAGLASLLGQHLVKAGLLPAAVARDFAVLLGLRNQADYNRHFLLDAQTMSDELIRVDTVFVSVEAFLRSRGVG